LQDSPEKRRQLLWIKFRLAPAGSRTENYLNYTGLLNTSTNYKRDQNSPITNVAQKSTRTVITYDFSVERSMLVFPTGAGNTLAARNAAVDQLLDRMDLYLCGGTLSNQYKASLRAATIAEMNTASGAANGTGTNEVTLGEATNIVRGVVMAIYASPSFLVTE
jgi:hypothetical protein